MFHDLLEKPFVPFPKPGTITRAEAVSLIRENGKKFFSVTFARKSDGIIRTLPKCQYGQNPSYSMAKYNLEERGLIGVFCFDPDRPNDVPPGNRSFSIVGILELKIGGKVYKVE